ncbi:MAG: toll/interleukin-1 receptor domain-containing protein [Blastocatellia bacterium]
MPQNYSYDVFLSYRRVPPVIDWVRNHFHPLLTQWLPSALPPRYKTRIFIDELQIETGATWPLQLQEALKNSRCLVPVWSPEYFGSKWCLAELKSMQKREQLLGLRSPQQPQGLIYPVVFSDGENFPKYAQAIQQKDLSQWNIPDVVFRQHLDYIDFVRQIKNLVGELARLIRRAPRWADWPVEIPRATPPRPKVRLPRL